ncbi:hypothetical protein T492DRAFT_869780, partial [Pavlovales sp. CCMP2436]
GGGYAGGGSGSGGGGGYAGGGPTYQQQQQQVQAQVQAQQQLQAQVQQQVQQQQPMCGYGGGSGAGGTGCGYTSAQGYPAAALAAATFAVQGSRGGGMLPLQPPQQPGGQWQGAGACGRGAQLPSMPGYPSGLQPPVAAYGGALGFIPGGSGMPMPGQPPPQQQQRWPPGGAGY